MLDFFFKKEGGLWGKGMGMRMSEGGEKGNRVGFFTICHLTVKKTKFIDSFVLSLVNH